MRIADQAGSDLGAFRVPLAGVELVYAALVVVSNDREGVGDVAEEVQVIAIVRIEVAEQGLVGIAGRGEWIRVGGCRFRDWRQQEVSWESADALAVRRGEERHCKKGAGDVPVSGRATIRLRLADGLLDESIGAGGLAVDSGEIGTARIPGHLTAERVQGADQRVAASIAAIRGLLRGKAVFIDLLVGVDKQGIPRVTLQDRAVRKTETPGDADAAVVPDVAAAERVGKADGRAADGVVTASRNRGVRRRSFEATSGDRISALGLA